MSETKPPIHEAATNTTGLDLVSADEHAWAHAITIENEHRQLVQHENLIKFIHANGPPKASRSQRIRDKLSGRAEPTKEAMVDALTDMRDRAQFEIDFHANGLTGQSTKRRESLGDIKERLRSLSEYDQVTLNMYLASSAPQFLAEQAGTATSYSQWLANRATDEQLVNFFQWHVHEIERQQKSPEVIEEIDTQKEEYKEGIKYGVRDGWLDPHALNAVEDVEKVRVVVGDIFDTLMQERGGYHVFGSDSVVIQQGQVINRETKATNLPSKLFWAAKHEFNHAVLGDLPWRWLREAITEHIAQVMDKGAPGVLSPAMRGKVLMDNSDSAYQEERGMLDALLNYGGEKIPLSLITRAYSENRSGPREAFWAMNEAFDRSFNTVNALGQIDKALQNYEDKALARGLSRHKAEQEAVRNVQSDIFQQPHLVFADRELVAS